MKENKKIKYFLYILLILLTFIGGFSFGSRFSNSLETGFKTIEQIQTPLLQNNSLEIETKKANEDIDIDIDIESSIDSFGEIFKFDFTLVTFDDGYTGYINLVFSGTIIENFFNVTLTHDIFVNNNNTKLEFNYNNLDYSTFKELDRLIFYFEDVDLTRYTMHLTGWLNDSITFSDTYNVNINLQPNTYYRSYFNETAFVVYPKITFGHLEEEIAKWVFIGYEKGKEEGINEYLESVDHTNDVFKHIWFIIQNATNAFFNIFKFEILPGLPLYSILSIPIIVAIFFFILKVVRH